MSVYGGPEISNDGLVLALDYGNSKTYSNPSFPVWKQFGGPLWSNFGTNISDRSLHQSTTSTKVLPYDESGVFGSHIDLEAFDILSKKKSAVWYKTIKSYDANGNPVDPGPGGTPIVLRLEFGPNSSMSDVIDFFLNNNSQQTFRLNDPIKVFQNGVSVGQTDLVINGWTGVGVSTINLGLANANDTFGEPSSNYLSSGVGRHIFSYNSNSVGRDTIRCQPTCWSGSENVVNEIVWSCSAPFDLIQSSREVIHNGYMEFDSGNLGSMIFDGVDDYITVGSIESPQQFTVMFWVNPSELNINSNNNYRRIVVESNITNWILIEQDGRISFRVPGVNTANYAVGNVQINQWSFVTCVYNQSTRSVYQNGILQGQQSIGSGTVNIGNVQITDTTAQSFKGKIANVQIYNRALSQSEIQQNFNALRGRFGI